MKLTRQQKQKNKLIEAFYFFETNREVNLTCRNLPSKLVKLTVVDCTFFYNLIEHIILVNKKQINRRGSNITTGFKSRKLRQEHNCCNL